MKKLLLALFAATLAPLSEVRADSHAVPGGLPPAQAEYTAGYPTTVVRSTAFEAGKVIRPSKGYLVSLTVYDSAAEYILVCNATSVPGNGAVTLLCPPIRVSADTTTMITFPSPLAASTGIVVCNSSTGTFTHTAGGSTCIFTAQYQ